MPEVGHSRSDQGSRSTEVEENLLDDFSRMERRFSRRHFVVCWSSFLLSEVLSGVEVEVLASARPRLQRTVQCLCKRAWK